MAIVVDTDVVSYLEKNDTRIKIYEKHLFNETKFISFMTLAELRRWMLERNWSEKRRAKFENFISDNYGVIFADDRLCEIWAEIKSDAKKKGRPIDTADAWVAAVALMFDIPLVTHNRKHFENVQGLKIISEGITLDSFDYGKKKSRLKIQTIEVVEDRKKNFDIAIPVLSPRIERIKEIRQIIENLDIGKIQLKIPLSLDTNSKINDSFTYEGRDVISNEVIIEREYKIPQAQTSGEIIAYYSKVLSDSLKLPAHFSTLAPKIEQLLREKIFGKEIILDSPQVLRALNESRVLLLTEKVFLKLLRPQIVEDKTPSLYEESSLISATPAFPYSGKVCEAKKTLFNLTPCGNDFEQSFAGFLDNSPDIVTFANLGNLPTKLSIEYLDSETNLRFYEPDFVAIDANGFHWLLETKGREDLDVQFKNQRAEKWCEDVTQLTGVEWRFQMIPQKPFEKMNPQNFSDLISGLTAGGVLFVEVDVI
jgi:type III restriction enzyme